MRDQLALALNAGTHHRCVAPSYAHQGCGREWECSEPNCRMGADAICPSCRNFGKRRQHSSEWVNRAKRDPEIARKVQRTAAIHAGVSHDQVVGNFDRPDWQKHTEDLRVRELPQ